MFNWLITMFTEWLMLICYFHLFLCSISQKSPIMKILTRCQFCFLTKIRIQISMILKTIDAHKKCKPAPWVRFDFKSCRNSLQRCVNIVKMLRSAFSVFVYPPKSLDYFGKLMKLKMATIIMYPLELLIMKSRLR